MAKFILSAFADEAADGLDGQIAALRDNGIGYIEPRFIDKRGVITLTDDELYRVRAELDAAGIRVGSLGSPIGKFPIDEDFGVQLEKFERALRACEILGADKMRMFSFYMPREERKSYLDEVARRLNEMTVIAAERGIALCHENEEKIYGESPEDIKELFKRVPALRGVYDPANFCVCGYDPTEGLEATIPRLAYLHIKDGKMKGSAGTERGMIILPAGQGDGRIGDALDRIDSLTDGEFLLTLEPHLFESNAFLGVDDRELTAGLDFKDGRDAFDAAVLALKELLAERGYIYGDGGYAKP